MHVWSFPVMSALVVLVAMPVVAATPEFGSEMHPELSDAAGNVAYSDFYTGPRDREHVDFLAAWYSYIPENDTVVFTVKVVSLEDVLPRTREWLLRYQFNGELVDGAEPWTMVHDFWKQPNTDEIEASTRIEKFDARLEPKGATFAMEAGAPGYLRWFVPAEAIKQRGEAITSFSSFVRELYRPAGVDAPIWNSNPDVEADGRYELTGLTPAGGVNGDREPQLTGATFATESSPLATKSSALTAFAVAFAFVLAAIIRGRKSNGP